MSDDEDAPMDYSEVVFSDSEAEDQPNDKMVEVSEKTKKILQEKCTRRVPNRDRMQIRGHYPLPKVPATRTPQLDSIMKPEAASTTKATDKQLAKVQTLLLDSLAPLTMLLEAHHRGDESDPKDVVRAVKAAVELIGNANAHMPNLQRVKVIGDINKALLPLVGDDTNFVEAPPLLFGTEFAQKGKEMVDQVKAMRSTFTSKPERRPPFFRNAPPPPATGGASVAGTERAEPKVSVMVAKDHTRQGEEPPRTATRAEHRTRKSSCMSASIPKRCVQTDCMPGHSARCIRSSSSWKAARSQKHLEGVDEGPLGVRHHKGSPNRFHIKALSGCGSSHSSLHGRSGSPDKGRVKRTPEQRSSSRGNKPSERVLLKSLPGPKKGRRAETRNKPKVPEHFRSDTTLQDGGNPYFEGPDTTRRLVGKSGSEGHLLCSPDPPLSSSIPQIQLPGEVLSVHLPPIWPVIGSLGLYQDPKASISSPPGDGSAPNSIHRRHPSPGGVPGTSEESCGGRSLPPTMSWVSDKLKEISAGTSTIYGIPGPDSGHCGHGIETPSGENEKYLCGGTKHGNGRTYLSPCHSKAGGKDECNISCHPTSPTVLSPSTDGTLRSTEQQLSVLQDTGFPLPLQQGGTEVVGQPHGEMEWEITPFQGDRYDNRLRCLPDRLGRSMSKSTDRRSVVSFREPDAYKLPRVVGSHTGSSDISETQNQVVSPPEVGQHLSSGIHKQPGRDSPQSW